MIWCDGMEVLMWLIIRIGLSRSQASGGAALSRFASPLPNVHIRLLKNISDVEPHVKQLAQLAHGMSLSVSEESFRAQTDAFLSWFRCQPEVSISSKIEVVDLRSLGQGRGVGTLILSSVSLDNANLGSQLLPKTLLKAKSSSLYHINQY